MGDNEEKALQLMAEADKKLIMQKNFFGVFGSSNKLDEAIDCYRRAGILFKMSKNWPKAGQCYCEAANLYLSGRDPSRHDAAICFVDASNCYKKIDIDKATTCLLKAIDIYADMGRFIMAAKYHQLIAEMYERDPNSLRKAIESYRTAADYFQGETSTSAANKCMLKVAQYSAQLEDYETAISIYEQVAETSLTSSLLKYCASEYFFRAALCHLSVDVLNCQYAIEKYCQLYPAFQDSREYKLTKLLCEQLEEENIDGFTNAIKRYESISRLDPWYSNLLLRIKRAADDDMPDLR